MKNKLNILTLFVVLTLFLAACGGASNQGGTPQGTAPGVNATKPVTGTTVGTAKVPTTSATKSSTSAAGGVVGGATATKTTGGAVGGATATKSTGGAAGGVATSTKSAGGAATATRPATSGTQTGGLATQSVPVTGAANVIRGKDLLGYKVEILGNGSAVTGTTAPSVVGTPTHMTTGSVGGSSTSMPTEKPMGTAGAAGGMNTATTSNYVRLSELFGFSVESNQATSGGAMGTQSPSVSASPTHMATSAASGGAYATPAPTQKVGSTAGAVGGASGAAAGQQIGSVADLFIPITGNANGLSATKNDYIWVVVSIDEGVLGHTANTLIPVPLSNAQVDTARKVIIFNFTSSVMEQAPSFSSTQWPTLSTTGWDSSYLSFWSSHLTPGNSGSAQPTSKATTSGSSMATPKATTTMGSAPVDLQMTSTPMMGGGSMMETGTPKAVGTVSGQGAVLGKVDDVLILLNAAGNSTSSTTGPNARAVVQYLIVTPASSVGRSNATDLVAIPWDRVQTFNPNKQVVVVNVTETELKNAPGFSTTAWPTMTANNWDQQWQQFWKTAKP